jgi:uncharacterized damage-inducible protein DinB
LEREMSDQQRPEPPHVDSETATLLGFLEYQRATLKWKCDGLNDAQLRSRPTPSAITLGGLLKHMAFVEDYWFSEVVHEAPRLAIWSATEGEGQEDWEWSSAAFDPGSELRQLWSESVQRSHNVVEAELSITDDDALLRSHPAWQGRDRVSLRWVLTHMIEEYARHNGHADILREAIDGATGE